MFGKKFDGLVFKLIILLLVLMPLFIIADNNDTANLSNKLINTKSIKKNVSSSSKGVGYILIGDIDPKWYSLLIRSVAGVVDPYKELEPIILKQRRKMEAMGLKVIYKETPAAWEVKKAITSPNTKALAWFGHGDENIPGLLTTKAKEDITPKDIRRWAQDDLSKKIGVPKSWKKLSNEERKKNIIQWNNAHFNLRYVYLHTCYGITNNDLPDILMGKGGIFRGYKGLAGLKDDSVRTSIRGIKPLIIAVRGNLTSKSSEGDRALYNYLGQIPGIKSTLLASNSKEFFEILSKYTDFGKKKKISKLIIEGHGNADKPIIILEDGEGVRPKHVDYLTHQENVKNTLSVITKVKKQLACLAAKNKHIEKCGKETDIVFLKERLNNQADILDDEIIALSQLESISNIMEPGGSILLLNCSSLAKVQGWQFVLNLAKVFLYKHGGQIVANTTDLHLLATSGSKWGIDGVFKWLITSLKTGKYIKPGEWVVSGSGWFGDRGTWRVINIPADKDFLINRNLKVSFDPFIYNGIPEDTIKLTPKVNTFYNSDELEYSWKFDKRGILGGKSLDFKIPKEASGILKISFQVKDSRGRIGRDTAYIIVTPLCIYQYSDWGECNKTTKVQERSILKKTPEGCIEADPPITEQPCYDTQDKDENLTKSSDENITKGTLGDKTKPLKIMDNDTNKSKVDSLIEEGSKLVEQDRLKEALEKFEESLKHSPDEQIEDYIDEIKKELALRDAEDRGAVGASDKKDDPKDVHTVKTPQDEGAEIGEGSENQETKDEGHDSITKLDLTKLAQQKWDWFKKDVPRYLNKLFAKSEGEYGILERRVHQFISEKKGTQKEADKCLVDAKKEAKVLRKLIGNAKKEHPKVLRKMHDDQGNPVKVLAHIKTFVNKYKIPKNLKISVSYSSSCLDNNATKELKVNISGSKSYHIKPTETVSLTAIANGGKAPVKIHWEGGNISPSGTTAIFSATTPGNYSVQVTAKDASGQSKSDAVTIIVKELNLPTLSGLPNEVYYGTTKIISVEGLEESTVPKKEESSSSGNMIDCKTHPDNPFCVDTSTGQMHRNITKDGDDSAPGVIMAPADDTEDFGVPEIKKEEEESEYEYVWQPTGEGLEFDPYQGKEPQVKVTFGNIGNVEIWAEVYKDGELVGETEPIKTKVIPPKFTLTALPVSSYIGDEIKATIDVQPNIDNKYLNFRWLPMGENVQQLGELKEGRVYRLKLKSIKSTTLEVGVWAQPYAEKEIDYLKYVVSAKPYEVSVSKPKRLDKAPWKWDIKQGKAIELPNAISVFQDAEVHAAITPEPKEKVSYKWIVSPEGCTASAPMSKSTNLNAHETGTYTVLVKVSDKNGVELGQASTILTVTVSQRDQDVAEQKAEDQKKAQELLNEGLKLWKEGKLQQAIAKVYQAQKIMGKDKEITKALNTMQKEKKQLDDKLLEASRLIKQGKLNPAKKILDAAAVISAKYEKYKEVLKQLTDAKKKAEEKKKQKAEDQKKAQELLQKGNKLWKEGKLSEAIVSIKEAQKFLSENQRVKQLISKMQKEKKQINKLLQQTETNIKQKKFKKAKGLLGQASKISQKYPPYVEMIKRVKKAEKVEKEKQKAVQKLQELLKKADTLWKNGALNKAIDTMKQAQKLLPKNKKIQKLLTRMRNDKKRLDNLLKDADRKMDAKQLQKAKTLLKKSAVINSKYPLYGEVLKRFESMKKKFEEVQKLLALAKYKWQGNKGQQAIEELNKILIIEARHMEASKLKREWQQTLHEVQKVAAEKVAKDRAEADRKVREVEEQAALAQKIKDIRAVAAKEANDREESDKKAKAVLAKKIQDIRDAANDKAEAGKQAALAQRIKDIRDAAIAGGIGVKHDDNRETIVSDTLPVQNGKGGYWKLVNTKRGRGRECIPADKYSYSKIWRYTIDENEGKVKITYIKRGLLLLSGKGIWQRPPEIMYADSTVKIPLAIEKLKENKDSGEWMSISVDIGGSKINRVRIDRKTQRSVHKTIKWKVRKGSSKKDSLTIRVYYSGAFICGNPGWKYNYKWVPEGSKSTDLNTEDIDKVVKDKVEADKKSREQAALAQKIKNIRKEAEGKNNESQNMEILSASGVVGNTLELITVALEPGNSKLIKIHITEGSELTLKTKGKEDGARIGEVEFYANGRKVIPYKVESDSNFGKGYSIEQIIDGDRQYKYMTSGAKGWASSQDEHRNIWLTFYFSKAVNITKVIVTTAPKRPYRLYSFSIIKYKDSKYEGESKTGLSKLDTVGIDGVEKIGSISKNTKKALTSIAKNLKEGIQKGRERMKKAEEEVKKAELAKQSGVMSTEGKTKTNKSGLIPTKIKLTTTKESYSGSDGTITSYITLTFWNVGAMVTGYERAILDIRSVASNGEVQNFHYVGTFEGGANGDMELSAQGMTVHISVIGGEKVTFDGEGVSVKIPNPSVFSKK